MFEFLASLLHTA